MSRPQLDKSTRKRLEEKLPPNIDKRAFFITLESAAFFAIADERRNSDAISPKDRRRKIASVQNNARALSEAIAKLDDDAVWYMFGQVAGTNELDGYKYRKALMETLTRIGEVAVTTYPNEDVTDGRESAARTVVEYFEQIGIPATESATGFCAECLSAAFQLCDFDPDTDVRYWIKKAKEKNRA